MADFDRYQADYEDLPFESTQVRFRRRKILEHLERLKPRAVLEVGCGLEPLCVDFTEFGSMTVVEPGRRFYDNAVRLATGRNNVSVRLGTLQQVAPALGGERFDCIVMSSLLHEVPQPAEVLRAAAALCDSSTTLMVNVPNANSFHRILAVNMGLIGSVYELSPTQKRMQGTATFDIDSLSSLLDGAGFEVVETSTFFVKPFTHAQMERLLQQGIMTEAMLEGLYAMSAQLPGMGSEIHANARLKG
jgi:2-polyprenyl-3-methyl-5-hydroxy-6-metoxy-1,4-benzoquinol methylase